MRLIEPAGVTSRLPDLPHARKALFSLRSYRLLPARRRIPIPTSRALIDFLLSITIGAGRRSLNIVFFHFIHDIFAGPHGQSQDRPGDVLIGLRDKGAAIHAEQVLTIMCLAPFVQRRVLGSLPIRTVPASWMILPGACSPQLLAAHCPARA
jgi:hypothetical protein